MFHDRPIDLCHVDVLEAGSADWRTYPSILRTLMLTFKFSFRVCNLSFEIFSVEGICACAGHDGGGGNLKLKMQFVLHVTLFLHVMPTCPHCQQDRSARTIRRHLACEARYLHLWNVFVLQSHFFQLFCNPICRNTSHEAEPVWPDDPVTSLQFSEEIFNTDDEKDTTGASRIK
jgi:hypothetical protein